MRPAGPEERHPALVLLGMARWDNAAGWLHGQSAGVAPRGRLDDFLTDFGDRRRMRDTILKVADDLYALGTPDAGARALAWLMLAVDPTQPESFWPVLPQLQWALDSIEAADRDTAADLRARLRIWWRAAEGEWSTSEVSIFLMADREVDAEDDMPNPLDERPGKTSTDLGLPTLVVMPKDRATKLNNHNAAYRTLVDAALPLVCVRDVAKLRTALRAEFPHATSAVDMLLRDLREGRPFAIRPVVLVGSPGCGKSRLVRRMADMMKVWVYRFDGAGSSDGQFSGTGKGWSNTEASVPMRAIAQSRTANPIVMLDEIDKAVSNHNGSLHASLLPFLDGETSARHRDQSLDAEVNLSAVVYISTANDPTRIAGALRDRFRTIRVPDPALEHLPALAASVMLDLAIEDEARAHDAALAPDELAVIGRAWRRAGLSLRNLQKIVRATLDARDQHAMRH